jgi:hypothetical protein
MTPSLYAWYTEPAAFITQVFAERGTRRDAEEVTRLVDQAIEHRPDEVARAGGILIIHDWRAMKGYDADARAFMMDRIRSQKPGRIREVVIVIDVRPLFHLALSAANAFLVLATGRSLRTVRAVGPELIRCAIRKPPPASRFPGAQKKGKLGAS